MNVSSAQRRFDRQAELLHEAVRLAAKTLKERTPVDRALNQWFRARKYLGSRDRRLIGNMVFSWLRWRGWFEQPERLPLNQQCVYAFCADAEELHPAILALSRQAGIDPASLNPLAGCSLQDKAAAFQSWLHLGQPPAVESLAPDWLTDRLPSADESTGLDRVLLFEQLQSRPPTWLVPMQPAADGSNWAEAGELPLAPSHWNGKTAWSVPGSTNLNAVGPAHQRPFEVQDLASQAVGWLCDPKPGQSWWDLCCGGGGKTLHLAQLMGKSGRITATDIRRSCIEELRTRAKRHNLGHIASVKLNPLEKEVQGGPFDGILVDAPCSGIGTWARNPDARWRTYENTINKQAALQAELLAKAAAYLKPGGCLVYSVCTLTRAETLGVTEKFLADHPSARLDPVPHPLTGEPTDGRIWIWPHQGPCNGMYVAKFRV